MLRVLSFDIETESADIWNGGPDFIRLVGWQWHDGCPPTVSEDPQRLISELYEADRVVGHNIFGFDLPALAHHAGLDYDRVAVKAWDTEMLARLVDPPQARAKGVDHERRYDLDSVAKRLGVAGKTDDLKALAKEYGGFDKIPRIALEPYLIGDVEATTAVYHGLILDSNYDPDYAAREMKKGYVVGSIPLRGWKVDTDLNRQRIEAGERRRQDAIQILADEYGLPTRRTKSVRARTPEGKFALDPEGNRYNVDIDDGPLDNPVASAEGKAALALALEQAGAESIPYTEKTGALMTTREAMQALAARSNPEVGKICDLIIAVVTVRTVYSTVEKYTVSGRVHPGVSIRQASGRASLSKPGITVFGKRSGRVVERAVMLPDDGEVLLAFDLDQVDMRAIAGLSRDPAYRRMFEPGRDAHSEIAKLVFGSTARRDDAKVTGHGWNYGMSVNRMINDGIPERVARQFDSEMKRQFPVLCDWRNQIRKDAETGALLNNGFGRLMRCDPARAWTQAPALMGQGCASDLMWEGILRLPLRYQAMIKGLVHDEIVLSVPVSEVDTAVEDVLEALSFTFRGVDITAGVSLPGSNWAACYDKPPPPPAPKAPDDLTDRLLFQIKSGEDVTETLAEMESLRDSLTPAPIVDYALFYASKDIPVFPVSSKTKIPMVKRGFYSATTDADQIRRWWRQWPTANIGMPTGSGFDVIDVDGPEGRESLKIRLNLETPMPTILAHAITPRDGVGHHLYVKASGSKTVPNALPKVDYKATGGYVLLPPSVGSTGRRYHFIRKPFLCGLKDPDKLSQYLDRRTG